MNASPDRSDRALASALYRGTVRHRRFEPRTNHFRYPVYLLYLDLDELGQVFDRRWLWSLERPNLVSFRRRDYYGDPDVPLDQAVRGLVEERTGRRPAGAIRLLTLPRTLGVLMNPASFYYCFSPAGELEHLVVDITNTPWGERYAYVLDASERHADERHARGDFFTAEHRKVFHVSPYMGMDMAYRWRFAAPGERLVLHVDNLHVDKLRDGHKLFDATVDLERRPLDGPNLARVLLRQPAMSIRVVLWIYLQAARLWLKKVPFIPHPTKRGLTPEGHRDLDAIPEPLEKREA